MSESTGSEHEHSHDHCHWHDHAHGPGPWGWRRKRGGPVAWIAAIGILLAGLGIFGIGLSDMIWHGHDAKGPARIARPGFDFGRGGGGFGGGFATPGASQSGAMQGQDQAGGPAPQTSAPAARK